MTLYLRQRNEALDEDQKVLKQQLSVYQKQLNVWRKSDKDEDAGGLELLDKSDYFKYKILISNFSEAVNQIIQNWGKSDFAGVGALQKTYEALARFVKDVVQGNYLTADKERVLNLLKPVIAALRSVNALAAENAFSSSEKVLVQTILNNIVEKNFEPIGFLPVPTATERQGEKVKRRGQDKLSVDDEQYLDLKSNLTKQIREAAGQQKKDLQKLEAKLKQDTRDGKITRKAYQNVLDALFQLTGRAPEAGEREFYIAINDPVYEETVNAIDNIIGDEKVSKRIRNSAQALFEELQQKSEGDTIPYQEFQNIQQRLGPIIDAAEAASAKAAAPPQRRTATRRSQTPQEGDAA